MPQEHGLSQKIMKEWLNRRSAKCSASSYKQQRNYEKKTQDKNGKKWNRKLENRKKWRMEKKKKKIKWGWNRRWKQLKHRLRSRQRRLFHERYRWRNWHSRNWRRRLDWLHKEKHRWSHGTDENSKKPMLDQNTLKNEMEISEENCIFTWKKMGNESSRMEPWTQHDFTKPTELSEDQRKDWKMKSMTSSDRKEQKMSRWGVERRAGRQLEWKQRG